MYKNQKNYKSVAKILDDEIVNLDVLMKYQQIELDKLTGSSEKIQQFNLERKLSLENKNFEKENLLKLEKQKVLLEIQKTDEIKQSKINKIHC